MYKIKNFLRSLYNFKFDNLWINAHSQLDLSNLKKNRDYVLSAIIISQPANANSLQFYHIVLIIIFLLVIQIFVNYVIKKLLLIFSMFFEFTRKAKVVVEIVS